LNNDPVRDVWTVGDSLSWGVGWPTGTAGGWRGVVAAALGDAARWIGSSDENPPPGRRHDRHDGHPGWRIDQLAALARPRRPPALAIVQAGTNDLLQRYAPGRPFHGRYDETDGLQRDLYAADLVARLAALVRALVEPGTALVLCSVTPLVISDFPYSSPSVAAVNDAMRDQLLPDLRADGYAAHLADLASVLAPNGAITPGLLGADGVHPTEAGYAAIARTLTPLVADALG
jgi:lysophospholipase L1-like esterase